MKFFRIKNWDDYQHRDARRHGRMPWIKFYTSALMDPKISSLTPHQFGIWARLLLCAGELNNKIPSAPSYLSPRLHPPHFPKRLEMQFLWDMGLIEPWTASLDKDEDKTKTKTKTFPRQRRDKKTDFENTEKAFKKPGWVNPAQERLRNNLEVARRLMEKENESE